MSNFKIEVSEDVRNYFNKCFQESGFKSKQAFFKYLLKYNAAIEKVEKLTREKNELIGRIDALTSGSRKSYFKVSQIIENYGVSNVTFKKWIKPFIEEIGNPEIPGYYSSRQVDIIYSKLGNP